MSPKFKTARVLVAGLFVAIFSYEGKAQSGNDIQTVLFDKVIIGKVEGPIDGPYSYKSPTDLIAIVGFVVGGEEPDDPIFRDCSGNTRRVKRSHLTRIQRNCPRQTPVSPWVMDSSGKIAPIGGYSSDWLEAYGMEKAKIDPNELPPEYKLVVKHAKPGDVVGVSYPSREKGKINLSISGKFLPQK
jgi:hypothetical protein